MEAEILNLKGKLEEAEKWKELALHSKPPIVHVSTPVNRKLKSFSGHRGECLNDWMDDARRAIHGLTELEGANWILSHLEGDARREVKYQPDTVKVKPETILAVLEKAFSERRSRAQGYRELYNRKQSDKETISEFSRVILEFVDRALEGDGTVTSDDRNKLAVSVFIENLADPSLTRELNRWYREHPDGDFMDLREYAVLWGGDVNQKWKSKPYTTFAQNQDSVEFPVPLSLESRLTAIEQQHSQILELLTRQGGPAVMEPKVETNWGQNVLCWNCGEMGHYARACTHPVKRRRPGRGPGPNRGAPSEGPRSGSPVTNQQGN